MGRTALITGASRGIGLAAAERFIAGGVEVIMNAGHDGDTLAREAKRLNTRFYCADVSDYAAAQKMMDSVHETGAGIDILINCAGVSHIGLFSRTEPGVIRGVIEGNLYTALNCCHLAVPGMVRRKWGRIINISSVWGITGASCEAAYSAAKGGVNAFTRALGKELAPSGITVNALACGVIDTRMNAVLPEDVKDSLLRAIPASRFGTPSEVAELCFYLAREEAGYINGQVITIDGGFI